jgi:hypothetical protein
MNSTSTIVDYFSDILSNSHHFMPIDPGNDKDALARLRNQLLECTDESGLPHAGLIQHLPEWLSMLLCATQAGIECDTPLWTGRSRRRFEKLLKQVLGWRRDDGRIVWPATGGADDDVNRRKLAAMERTAVRVATSLGLFPPHATRRRGRRSRTAAAKDSPPNRPASQSDAAEWAWLRSDRSRRSDSIVVTHHEAWPHFEFAVLGRELIRGPWPIDVRFNSRPVEISGRWECVCWNSDSQADYLELQLEQPHVTIERQVLLSRREHFALVADVVRFPEQGVIDFTSMLPLAANLRAARDRFTRELRLHAKGLRVRVFPLALPQSVVEGTGGSLGVETSGVGSAVRTGIGVTRSNGPHSGPYAARQEDIRSHLTLHQIAQGRAIYAPLLFDWSPKRSRVAADWRTLTVTEELSIVRPDVAAGHRLRLGDKQWLVYRSLLPSPEPRAVLGHQTRSETVIGWFTPTGDVRPIMQVE